MNARVICESGVRNCQLNWPWCARSMSLVRRRETHPVPERWRVYNQIMYNAKVKVPWLIGTKHFPESKIIPRIQNNFGFWEVFWRSVFGFWDVFWILGSVLAKFFWILGSVLSLQPPYKGTLSVTSAYAMRTSVINSQIVLILRLICHDQRIYEQIIFCKTGIKVTDCIFLHK